MLFRSVKSAMPTDPAVGTGKPSHVLWGPYGDKLHRSAKTPQGRQAGNWQATTGTKSQAAQLIAVKATCLSLTWRDKKSPPLHFFR